MPHNLINEAFFMGLRSATDVQEEYNAVRQSYLKALDAEKLAYASGTTTRSLERSKSLELKQQLTELSAEYNRLSRGSSMKSYNLIPEG